MILLLFCSSKTMIIILITAHYIAPHAIIIITKIFFFKYAQTAVTTALHIDFELVYTPTLGTICDSGSHRISCKFVPGDPVNYYGKVFVYGS